MARFTALTATALALCASAFAQSPACTVTSQSPTLHPEGLTEITGTISIVCVGGTPGGTAILYFTFVTLNTNITNRVAPDGTLDVSVTVNTGSGAVPVAAQATLSSPTSLTLNSISYTIPALGQNTVITIGNLRAAVASITGTVKTVVATVNGSGVIYEGNNQSTVGAATTTTSILESLISGGIPCAGSPSPSPTTDIPGLLSAGTTSSTLRITEAFPTALYPQGSTDDTGLRVLVNISGYGSASTVYVPNAIVGNDGSVPTSAGAFGGTPNGGTFTPGFNQLLLSLVTGANASGIGGTLVLSPSVLAGSATGFTSITQVPLTNGAGYVVYEVMSANPLLRETAQIPVFVATPANACSTSGQATFAAEVSPVSTVATSTATDPVPRFVASMPGSDCTVNNDCGAYYFPTLYVNPTPIALAAPSLGSPQSATILTLNTGQGQLPYTATVTYPAGAATGWLSVSPASGIIANTTLTVTASPATLQAGVYMAGVVVNSGAYGIVTVPVTFTVGVPGVTIQSAVNAASLTTPVAPGSYVSLMGLNLTGTNVSVTVNQVPATVIYSDPTEINVILPTTVLPQPAALVIATVNGQSSPPFSVDLVANAPGIFVPGIENPDDSVNGPSAPATRGSFIAVYLTGFTIPLTGSVTVNIGNQTLTPLYAGPTVDPALDQVNVTVPTTVSAGSVPLSVCITGSGQPVCSNVVTVYLQ